MNEPAPPGRKYSVFEPLFQYCAAAPVFAVGAVTLTDGAPVSTFAVALAADGADWLPTLSDSVRRYW